MRAGAIVCTASLPRGRSAAGLLLMVAAIVEKAPRGFLHAGVRLVD